MNRTLAIALAYDVAFGWPVAWGSVGNVCDDLNFINDVVPVLIAQVLDPNNFGKFEFMRLVNGLPYQGFYDGDPPPEFLALWQHVLRYRGPGRVGNARRGGGGSEPKPYLYLKQI